MSISHLSLVWHLSRTILFFLVDSIPKELEEDICPMILNSLQQSIETGKSPSLASFVPMSIVVTAHRATAHSPVISQFISFFHLSETASNFLFGQTSLCTVLLTKWGDFEEGVAYSPVRLLATLASVGSFVVLVAYRVETKAREAIRGFLYRSPRSFR